MTDIIETLTERGCRVEDPEGLSNTLRCSESYLQKFPDKPWTVLVKREGGLSEIRDRLLDIDVEVSGIGMGRLEREGAWSKIERFSVDRGVEIHIFDEELEASIGNEELALRAERMGRLAKAPAHEGGINVQDLAGRELGAISDLLEREVETSYTKSLGNTICAAEPEARRVWSPGEGTDVLQYKVVTKCLLPPDMGEKIREEVESVGDRETFKTVHRSGIDSIVTPDRRLFLRKVVFHDRNLGGPFLAFGVRDRKFLTSDAFMEELRALEGYLGSGD
jgi:hypothetical protein